MQSPGRVRAVAPVLALSFATACVVHWLIHAALDPSDVFSTAHVVEGMIAVASIACALGCLGFGRGRTERRRRVGLVRAMLPRSTSFAIGLALAESGIAGLLFVAEGATFDPLRIAVAVFAGALALVVAALTLRGGRLRAISLLVALAELPIGPALLPIGVFARRRKSRLTSFRLLRRPRFRGPPLLLPSR